MFYPSAWRREQKAGGGVRRRRASMITSGLSTKNSEKRAYHNVFFSNGHNF
jgi:hypothetical protein